MKSAATTKPRRAKSVAQSPKRAPARQVDLGSLEDRIVGLALSGKLAGAARNEIRAIRKLGLPLTFKRGNKIVKEFPDGRVEVLETLEKRPPVVPKGVKIIGRQ